LIEEYMKNVRQLFVMPMLLGLLFTFSSSFGQDTIPDPMDDGGPKRVSGGYGYAVGGYSMKDVDGLATFVGNGTTFSSGAIGFGGGGMLMVRSVMLGGEGFSNLKQSASFGSQDLTFESGWGKFYVGYVLLGKKGLLLYPKVGIGGYKESLTLTNRDADATMDTVFTGVYSGTNLVKKGVLMSFGAGFEWMPGFDQTSGSGVVFGLDLGYNLALTEGAWQAFEADLTGGPVLKPNGIYANLHIGFGGWNRQ
jgi:hypothetical protein